MYGPVRHLGRQEAFMPASVWAQFHVRYLSFTVFSMLEEPPSVRMDRNHLKPNCEGA